MGAISELLQLFYFGGCQPTSIHKALAATISGLVVQRTPEKLAECG
jgi:hypothetical protein